MSNQDLTIVINTFNSDEKIFSCLDSINPNLSVLIIENSKNIEFKKNIEKKYPNVSCELTGENLGYANGNNLGLYKVTSKFALILNPDTEIEKNSIENFFKSANTHSDFAIISPAIQEEKDVKLNKYDDAYDLISVDNVKGFAMFLNMKEFKDIGFFDKNFFIYFEEIDLCRRLKLANKKIYLDPNIIIYHVGGSSHNKSIDYEMELSRNWHWMWSTFYYHKKYSGFTFAFIKISNKLVSSLFKTLFYLIIFKKNKKNIYYQRASGLINSIIGNKSWYRPKVF